MPSPPKPKGTDDLAEVERALSVLSGRHPEHERVRREDEARRAKRRAELDAESRAAARDSAARRLKVIAIGAVSIVVLSVLVLIFRSEIARRGKIDQAGNPYRAMGFVVIETTGRSAPGRLEAKTPPGCLLAVSTSSTATLEVARGSGGPSIAGPGPVLLCTCQDERVIVTSSSPDASGGLALLRIDASVFGGSRAFTFLPFKPGTLARTDDACADAALDAWIDAKRAPRATVNAAKWGADPQKTILERVKLVPVATLARDAPFVVLDVPKESCVVAMSDVPDDRLSLRAHGGATPVPPTDGTIAHCTVAEATMLLARTSGGSNGGEVTVLAGPAASLGGVLGLREIARDVGLPLREVVLAPADRAWDAKQALLGSGVPEALVTMASTPDIAPQPDARVVAVSLGTPSALVPELATEVYSYCDPPLDEKRFESLCIFSGPATWRTGSADAVGGIARARRPFWLFAMDGVVDPIALKAEADLLALARRLRRDGFEPTTLEAMTELPNGVEVLGRSGEDAVVAIGLAPLPPYVFPYGDGPWPLAGPPRIMPVKTLEKVTLTTTEKKLPPKEKRRTVVFRRQKR